MFLLINNPQFRLLWASSTIAGLSGIMYMMVHGWLTLTITDSPFWVGAVAGIGGLGLMLLSIPGGVLADRLSRRNLMIGSGLGHAVAAALLAALFFAGDIRLWHVIGVAVTVGVAGGIRVPAFMAMVPDLAGRERLLSANAAIFASFGIAGIVAPLIGGFVVDALDFGWAYVIMAGGELGAVAVLLRLSVKPRMLESAGSPGRAPARRESPWVSLKQGVRYVFTTPSVRAFIGMGLVSELFLWAHISMLPVMARNVLGAGVTGLGYLQSASFAGFLFSNLALSSMPGFRKEGWLLVVGSGGFGLFLILFAASRSFPLSLVLLATAYGVGALYDATLSTLIQKTVPDEMRGRVVSFQAFTWGVNGLSGFYMGAVASALGAPWAIAIGAGVFLAYTVRMVPVAARLGREG